MHCSLEPSIEKSVKTCLNGYLQSVWVTSQLTLHISYNNTNNKGLSDQHLPVEVLVSSVQMCLKEELHLRLGSVQ